MIEVNEAVSEKDLANHYRVIRNRLVEPGPLPPPNVMDEIMQRLPAVNQREVIAIVARAFRLTVDELLSYDKHGIRPQARQIAMTICVEMFGLSFPRVGRRFNRDHTTVLHAHKRYGGLIREELRKMRTRLADRRASVTSRVIFAMADGKEIGLTVTFGLDQEGNVREAFCADFKAGSDLHAIVMDSCILLSRLLQHGDAPEELARTLCAPPSLIGCIAKAASEIGPLI
jgi:hypothetical protein